MRTKQLIAEKTVELDNAAGEAACDAARSAYRYTRVKQADERRELQAECAAQGGHIFSTFPNSYNVMSSACMFCGAEYDANRAARNLTTPLSDGRGWAPIQMVG